MSAEDFRKYGHEVVDWIAAYYERVEGLPVRSEVEPGAIRALLPAHPPETGEGFDGILADLDRVIMPGLTHGQHPSFFGYFPANSSGPGVLGDLLASGLGVQGMLWSTSPAATELETHVLDWLAELLDLPPARSTSAGGGVIQHSASDAVLVALLAALHRVSGGATERGGVGTGRYTVYTSHQTHSAVEKACRVAGLGSDALRKLDVDPATMAARPEHLRALLESDRVAGYTPAMVVASIGATGTGAIDPVGELPHRPTSTAPGARRRGLGGRSQLASCADQRRVEVLTTPSTKWLLTSRGCGWLPVDLSARLPEFLAHAATGSGAFGRKARSAGRLPARGRCPLVRRPARTSGHTWQWRRRSRPGSRLTTVSSSLRRTRWPW
jgi:aromatic-L-amino-acid decarboxylase